MSSPIRLLFSWTWGDSQWWWCCSLVVIEVVVGGGEHHVYLLRHRDWKSTVDFFQLTIITTRQKVKKKVLSQCVWTWYVRSDTMGSWWFADRSCHRLSTEPQAWVVWLFLQMPRLPLPSASSFLTRSSLRSLWWTRPWSSLRSYSGSASCSDPQACPFLGASGSVFLDGLTILVHSPSLWSAPLRGLVISLFFRVAYKLIKETSDVSKYIECQILVPFAHGQG